MKKDGKKAKREEGGQEEERSKGKKATIDRFSEFCPTQTLGMMKNHSPAAE